jgi:tol-pal system protein YbgF
LAFSVLGLAVAPVHAQSERDMANRLSRVENEMRTLARAIYKGEEPPPGAFSGGGADSAALGVRMDQLETQLRDMNGRLEEQGNQIDQLRQQLERMSGDIDMRLNSGAGGAASAPYTTGGYVPPQPSASTVSSTSTSAVNYGAPQEAPYPQDTSPQGGYSYNSGGASATSGTLGTVGATSPSPNDPAAMAYENAFSLLKSGQYDAAERGFNDFLSQNPGHSLAGNAKYWLGESYYARGQYDKASRTFAEAYQQYPKSSKAPDNLLKLGMSLAGQGKKDDACIALGQIEKEFASTAGPVLRRAKEEMSHFGCS